MDIRDLVSLTILRTLSTMVVMGALLILMEMELSFRQRSTVVVNRVAAFHDLHKSDFLVQERVMSTGSVWILIRHLLLVRLQLNRMATITTSDLYEEVHWIEKDLLKRYYLKLDICKK